MGLLSEQGRDKTSGRGNTRDAVRVWAREEGRGWGQEVLRLLGYAVGPWEMELAWVESVMSRSAQ